MSTAPSLRLERGLLREGALLVAGIDEVGRGALSGPVSVGVTVVGMEQRALAGVRDSKLLTPAARSRLVPHIKAWAVDCAVGHASAAEIDGVGIVPALRQAALRALASLSVHPGVVILDGRHDWLSSPAQGSLLDLDAEDVGPVPRVVMRVKADMTCTSVAAASVLAKVERDAIMTGLHRQHPEFGWDDNKGYASPEHVAALRRLGPTEEHRRSWQLPG